MTINDLDCMEYVEHVDGIESCTYDTRYNACTYEEIYCNAVITINGEVHQGTCEDIEAYASGSGDYNDYNDYNDYGDDECVQFVEDDCMDMFPEVEGVESCWYNMMVDVCTGEDDMESC